MAKISFDNRFCISHEISAYPGVIRAAASVREDIFLVTGFRADEYVRGERCRNLLIYGTIGRSSLLDELSERGVINLGDIRGKREVYGFFVADNPVEGVDHALIIAGADKRGTIYGLYHLSELLGVSPFVNWNHVMPKRRKNVSLSDEVNLVSREPSVKYRGFFINDEWPAFGNWANRHFDGINARCYENIFELLLRLKGNYLWPAMWDSNFSLDGPGLESARLADEYGIVMSTSHHEPCMRSGEEYTLFRGEGSIYGDAWDFIKNREGITRFWRDGLLRNKNFENVITMGMRGERDSAILDKSASLSDNVNLLRDVIKTQNRLIQETIDEDLEKVPRQLVLFTEVEEFFYGDENTKGLMDDPELDGVTLMLSDNNCGYTRTLPSEEMRGHNGGFGMYYHMDMHGGPYSYQWIGGTYLPRVWEQMSQAYDFGVREIWVVNVGDIGTQEFGLSFFLDMAYDMDRWGGNDASVTREYASVWIRRQFEKMLTASGRKKAEQILWAYTDLLEKRKHEIMNADVYHPLHYGEAEWVLETSEMILKEADALKKKLDPEDLSAFVSLLYYPACGTANLMKLWILAGRNKLYASQNRIEANLLAEQMDACIKRDDALIDEYESVDNGKYSGFGRSEHIGFVNWNDEDNHYPVRHLVYGAHVPRMLVSRSDDEKYMTGLYWCDHPQVWRDTLRADVSSIEFDIINGSEIPFQYRIETDCEWLSFSRTEGKAGVRERITLAVDKSRLKGRTEGSFSVENPGISKAVIKVEAAPAFAETGVFMEHEGVICMEARHYSGIYDTDKGKFVVMEPYGRRGSAVKVFPATADFMDETDRPMLEYRFRTEEDAGYRLVFELAPTTPVVFKPEQYLGYEVNDGGLQVVNTVKDTQRPFFLSRQWEEEAKNAVKTVEQEVSCRQGINTLRFYGMSPGMVLERIVLVRADTVPPVSYLGPPESCRGLMNET